MTAPTLEVDALAAYSSWKQSSQALENVYYDTEHHLEEEQNIDPGLQLMYLASEGDLEGIKELLDSAAADVNFRDVRHRTALHVAACQGYHDVAELLLDRGAQVDPKDRWKRTPLMDAMRYKNHKVINLLEKHGAKQLVAPMHVKNVRLRPYYEIDSTQLDFTKSIEITKGTYRVALWQGTSVAVKIFWEENANKEKLEAFRDELALLLKVRHPNVVQFLGAVTQTKPMMIVTEYLPKGDLLQYLKRSGSLRPETALKFAMDIARGMNYLHENKPAAIIHRDLQPSNILLDDFEVLKIADLGISKLLKVGKIVKEGKPLHIDYTCRYVAPEFLRNEAYDTKIDVYSFGIILQEMIGEYCPIEEVPEASVAGNPPPFRPLNKSQCHELRKLIDECGSEYPANRPTFKQIIARLDAICGNASPRIHFKVSRPLKCFPNWTGPGRKALVWVSAIRLRLKHRLDGARFR